MRKDSRKKVRKSEQKLSRYLESQEMMEKDIDRNIRLQRIKGKKWTKPTINDLLIIKSDVLDSLNPNGGKIYLLSIPY